MKVFIGTSGWSYFWNPKKNLQWYIENTPFNAVEVNSTFYRFPYESFIKSWAKFGERLRFVIKVHRSITHIHRLNELAKEQWNKFQNYFIPLDSFIDFYLFQVPPSFKSENINRVLEFAIYTKLEKRFAFEPRSSDWFTEKHYEKFKECKITFVSVNAPKLPNDLVMTTDILYLRFHGKEKWYSYVYTEEELKEIAEKIKNLSPEKVYIFFNNDTGMLPNGETMAKLLS
ncbi:MAG: DUF72 domain-containing protein [Dictyoglomus sp.]|nr:DUF72 domain-containing protein [Dictyoglomus sp.]MCX7941709.1 DUF72 domain-containing protein [Dictyoglomaceae bacterium]MDW8189069.1 DUF72 domain-containing protein [Dictyoglomus sp.]